MTSSDRSQQQCKTDHISPWRARMMRRTRGSAWRIRRDRHYHHHHQPREFVKWVRRILNTGVHYGQTQSTGTQLQFPNVYANKWVENEEENIKIKWLSFRTFKPVRKYRQLLESCIIDRSRNTTRKCFGTYLVSTISVIFRSQQIIHQSPLLIIKMQLKNCKYFLIKLGLDRTLANYAK